MPPKKGGKARASPKKAKVIKPVENNIKEGYFGTIEVHINYLESKIETGMFTLIIVYANNFVGKVAKINIPDGGGCFNINRKFYLYIKAVDNYMMDALISTPFFFSLLEGENRVDPKHFATHGMGAAIQMNVVGQGNLGIMPLLTGQKEMESQIVLEPPGVQETVFFKRKYSEHPRLYVKLVDARSNLSAKEMNNIMWLSVESVYNLDKSNFLEDAEHTLVFPMPSTTIDEEHVMLEEMFAVGEEPHEEVKRESKKHKKPAKPKASPRNKPQKQNRMSSDPPPRVEIKKPPDLDLIQFDRGIYKYEQTIDIRKKWASLASINGAPAMTDQRIKTDSLDLMSTIPIDLRHKFRKLREPRIEWNMVRPIWLHTDLENLVKERIMQYGVWPIELLMLGKIFLGPEQLSANLKAKIADEKEIVKDLRSAIDNIFSEFKEVVEILNTIGNETAREQTQKVKKLTQLEARIQELLTEYEPKQKGNFLVHMPFIEKLREAKKSRIPKEEGSVSPGDSASDITEGPKEFLNQNDIVLLERKAYIAWVDLSPLLVPGCTHLRTAGVLQYFNREEAVAKWGLTTTFSGDADEMSTRDKDLSRLLTKDPVDINKIYMDLKKTDLIKDSTNLLLLLGRLIELSNNIKKTESEPGPSAEPVPETLPASPNITELEDKKKTKALKFHDEKKKVKPKKHSKTETDGPVKKKTDLRNLTPKTGQLKMDSTKPYDDTQNTNWLTMKAFDLNEMRQPTAEKIKKPTSKIPINASSAISEEQLVDEEGNVLKKKTMQHYLSRPASHSRNVFAVYKTTTGLEGKNIKSMKKDQSNTLEKSPTELIPSDLSHKDSTPEQKKLPFLQPDSKFKNKSQLDQKPTSKQSVNELEESRILQPSVQSRPKKTSSEIHDSLQTISQQLSQISGEESLLDLFRSLLATIIDKYEKLKDRYQILKTMKAKEGVSMLDTSEEETISLLSESDCDGETTDGHLSSHNELDIKKVEPRHKMWHIGQNLVDDVVENQIQYTNDVRKMAVLEREFLLLKRLRLAQMKHQWEEKLRDITPEYIENAKGEKVVVIIDIKLLKPLVPKPELTIIDLDIQEFLKDRCMKTNPIYYANDTAVDFHNCIVNLSNLITSEYQDFKKSYSTVIDPLSGETGNEFYAYIEKSRAHQIIAESLSEGMKGYLSTALRDPIPTADQKNDQKKLRYYVGWLYSRVVDEMQSVVNKNIIDGDHSLPETNLGDLPYISCYDLYLFAVEAIEEMDYDRAKYYLAKRLEGDKSTEPMNWIEYAVIALRIGDFQQAMECIKEALVLNSRCKEGLILYAVMLMTEGRFEDAQLFFNAVINFYPMFIEGWMAFHMFYLITENKTGADITLVAGTKISHDFKLPSPMKPPQLSWDNKTWIEEEPGNYISTAIYFLSFNLYEIAEVCLAQELERVGSKSLVWVYYLSVCHYIQGRYEDSAKHLSKAISELKDYNMDPRIWILLGHNCWMMGLKKCAVQMYLQSFTTKRNHLHEHMTFIRIVNYLEQEYPTYIFSMWGYIVGFVRSGFFFLENEKARFAKQMFLRAVRQQGTPMGWLGLGIALFMEGKIDDAELALKEANMLDTTLATAWGYLALISLYKLKEEQFLHCFREAKRYGLNDKKLTLEIESISEQIASHIKSKLS